jgi:predicted aldo/keto reductase-like oxidoreductase
MEGLLGGRLSRAPANVQALYDEFPVKRSAVEWAFRWLCNHPEVSVVLSGCNEEEQIDENLRIFNTVEPEIMSEDELALMRNVRKAYLGRTKIGCTGCKYCMPCPNDVNIPGIFSSWNNVSLYDLNPANDWGMKRIRENNTGADKCIACGACEAACPQHLPIIEQLKCAWSELA